MGSIMSPRERKVGEQYMRKLENRMLEIRNTRYCSHTRAVSYS